MKTIQQLIRFFTLFLLITTITYATDYYVDKNANGNNNGTSWVNAWQSFSSINWGQIQPGDVVYISGGTDSTVYTESVDLSGIYGTATNFITIRNSYESGHNGRVILDGNNYTLTTGFHIDYSSYVYIKGLEVRNFNGGDNDPAGGIEARHGSNVITFDSMLVYNNYGRQVIFQSTDAIPADGCTTCVDSVTIKNSYIVTPTLGLGQTDCMYAMGAKNIFVDNNYMRMRNNEDWNNSGHADVIQAYLTRGWTITNNYIVADENTRSICIILGAVHLTASSEPDNVIIYNNFILAAGTNERPLETGGNGGVTDLTVLLLRYYSAGGAEYPPTYVMNNTIISSGKNYMAFSQEYPYTYAANNIFAQFGDGVGEYHGTLLESSSSGVCQVDSFVNNLIYREWTNPSWYGSWYGNGITGTPNSSNWFTTYGATGAIDNPYFEFDFFPFDSASLANYTIEDWKAGTTPTVSGILTDYSPAIGAGENIQYRVESLGLEWVDINGNPRGSTPDIGAYQYGDPGPDLTPPRVIGAALQDSVTLVVSFSESLDQTTAEDETNYSITNNIDVFNASLTGSKVTLQTSVHSPGSYIVTIVNVEDLAGNPIAQNNTGEYILIPPDSLMMFPVENVEGIIVEPDHTPEKTIDGLGALDGDPDSRWAAEPMPEELIFDLGITRIVCKTRLSFYNWNYGRVYNYSIAVSSDHNNWTTVIPQGTSASNEEWTIDEFSPIEARYIQVHFINNNQSNWAGLWEGEIWGIDANSSINQGNNGLLDEFNLFQNYPNPFNPTTNIRFRISDFGFVSLKVYDVLGNEIVSLVNEEKAEGDYNVNFDASGLSSGIYFYRLQAGSFVETKKMILMK